MSALSYPASSQAVAIVAILVEHPVLVCALGIVVCSTLVTGMVLFRRHRFRLRRERSPTGHAATDFSLEPLPVRQYPEIDGFIEASVAPQLEVGKGRRDSPSEKTLDREERDEPRAS